MLGAVFINLTSLRGVNDAQLYDTTAQTSAAAHDAARRDDLQRHIASSPYAQKHAIKMRQSEQMSAMIENPGVVYKAIASDETAYTADASIAAEKFYDTCIARGFTAEEAAARAQKKFNNMMVESEELLAIKYGKAVLDRSRKEFTGTK